MLPQFENTTDPVTHLLTGVKWNFFIKSAKLNRPHVTLHLHDILCVFLLQGRCMAAGHMLYYMFMYFTSCSFMVNVYTTFKARQGRCMATSTGHMLYFMIYYVYIVLHWADMGGRWIATGHMLYYTLYCVYLILRYTTLGRLGAWLLATCYTATLTVTTPVLVPRSALILHGMQNWKSMQIHTIALFFHFLVITVMCVGLLFVAQ